VKHALRRDGEQLGLPLDDEAVGRLAAYLSLLGSRAIPLGLIAESDRRRLYERHVLDCLRAAVVLLPTDRRLIDMGSGAGLPGLVVACVRRDVTVVLVDSRRRAAAFLEAAADELRLRVDVRIERLDALEDAADACTARALAPLPTTWELAHPLLRPGGRLIYFAGAGLKEPGTAAEAVRNPAPPSSVQIRRVIESSPPLVIMERSA
jgi:16S rRNA (guanine527-N7)-methyltransferase